MTLLYPLESAAENILSDTATLVQAIQAIEKATIKIVLVVDAHNILIGSVTDGDIRRALLNGKTQDAPLHSFMHRNPYSLPPETSRAELLAVMETTDVKHIPLVDKTNRILGIVTRDGLLGQRYTRRTNPVIIMAGGKGTRMLPLTTHIPKPMVEINGRPMLEWIVKRFTSQGFSQFYFAINHLGHIIESHFGDGAAFDCDIHYIREPKPLGTAGAISLLPESARAEPMVVINGDIMARLDFGNILDFHLASHAIATVCTKEHRLEVPFGVIEMRDGYLTTIAEKPSYAHHVSAGIYVLNPQALDCMETNAPIDMPTLLLQCVSANHNVAVFPIQEEWADVGCPDALAFATINHMHA